MQQQDLFGREFGGYVVDSVEGHRPWGWLCFGHSIRFEAQQVVIRILDPELERSRPQQVRAFLDRSAKAVMIPHPSVVDVFATGKSNGLAHVITPRLKQPTLSDLLLDHGAMDELAAVTMAAQLLDGLRMAADKGLAPIGLCPSEIVPIDGKQTKITNLAWPVWMLFEDVASPDLEPPYENAYYLAPEGNRADLRADNYALGMILYHAVAGKLPFVATSLAELRRLHREQDPAPVRSVRPEISQVTSDFIAQMISKRVIERPQTYDNVQRWLEAAITRSRTNAAHSLVNRYRQELDTQRKVETANLESAPIPRAEFLVDSQRERPKPPPAPVAPPPAAEAAAKTGIKTILVADDNPGQVALMVSILKRHGYHCLQASDGANAFSLAKARKPDLIFLDVVMGDDDGYAACRKLKRDPVTKDIPVVFVTSKSEEADRLWQTKLGANAFVPKPIDPDAIIEAVRDLVGY